MLKGGGGCAREPRFLLCPRISSKSLADLTLLASGVHHRHLLLFVFYLVLKYILWKAIPSIKKNVLLWGALLTA